MELDPENFCDWEDMEDTLATLRNRLTRAQDVQPIEHEDAKRLLRKTAARASAQ